MQPGAAQNGPIDPRPEKALNHVAIVVADYDAALEFYTEELGLRIAYALERDGEPLLTYLYLNRETFIELLPARGDQQPGIEHIGIEVADIDATVARLREHGREINDPGMSPGRANFTRFRDDEGTFLEILQFGPEAQQRQAMEAW